MMEYNTLFDLKIFFFLSYGRNIIDIKAHAAFLNSMLNEDIPSIEDEEDDGEEESQNFSDEK